MGMIPTDDFADRVKNLAEMLLTGTTAARAPDQSSF
jgi:hypothetical protein